MQTVRVSFTVEHADVTGETTTEKGKDYSFTVEANTGYEVTKVTYQVGNGKTKTATSEDGKYTVPGKDVTGDLKIQITVEAISYTITYFNPFGNTATDSYTYAEGKSALKEPKKIDGYKFEGWYKANGTSLGAKVDSIGENETGDIELYANWTVLDFKCDKGQSGLTYVYTLSPYNTQNTQEATFTYQLKEVFGEPKVETAVWKSDQEPAQISLKGGSAIFTSVTVTGVEQKVSVHGVTYTLHSGLEQDVEYDKTDRTAPDITASVESVEVDGKQWVTTGETLTVTVIDKSVTGEAGSSGLKTVTYQVNGGDEVKEEFDDADGYDILFTWEKLVEKADDENKVEIAVTAEDQNGNQSSKMFTYYIDDVAPSITSITASKDPSTFWDIIFGKKEKVEITVVVEDASSGVGSVTLIVTDGDDNETVTNKLTTGKTETVFELPGEYLKKDKTVTLSFVATDNAGNKSEKIKASDLNEALKSDGVLWDNQVPVIEDNNKGNDVYVPIGEDTWIKADQSLSFTVKDPDQVKNNKDETTSIDYSGLQSVTVTLNGSEMTEKGYSLPETTEGETDEEQSDEEQPAERYHVHDIEICYSELSNGKNTIVITAVDNAGNITTASFIVWKDGTAPVVTESGDNKYYQADEKSAKWVMKDQTLTFTVEDPVERGDDPDGTWSSGMDTLEAAVADKTFEPEQQDGSFQFKIPYEELSDGENTITITAVDKVGNVAGDNVFVVWKDTTAPTGSITLPAADYVNGSNRWYNEAGTNKQDLIFEKSDEDSGVKSYEIHLNGSKVYENADPTTLIALGVLNQGENTVELVVYDNVGNCSKTESDIAEYFYVDTVSPAVENFDFSPSGSNTEYGDGGVVTTGTYGYFFSKDTDVTVNVVDGPESDKSSGIQTIYFLTKDVDGTIKTAHKDLSGNGTSATFTVKAGFKGEIYACVADNVNNEPAEGSFQNGGHEYVRPENTVVETGEMHKACSDIEIALPGTAHQDSKGQPLYSGDVTVPITVQDNMSGIKEIKVTVEAAYGPDKTSSYELSIGHSGSVGDGWTKVRGESNLVYAVTRNITITNNSNDVKITVALTDQAGNTSSEERIISIDKTMPEVTVSYDNNDVQNERYFKADRTVSITVRDANFNGADIACSRTGTGLNFGGSEGEWNKTGPDENGVYTYTLSRTFSEDGDYLFNMSVTDRAGNQTGDNQVKYEGAAVHDFVVDKTMPELTMSLIQPFSNGHYLMADDSMTVTVNEHNFDAAGYTASARFVDVNDGSSQFMVSGTWSGSGDVHSISFPVQVEGTYYVESVTFTDLAGNSITVRGMEVGYSSFDLDKTMPVIEIRNGLEGGLISGTANKGAVTPTVVVKDTNFSQNDVTVTLTGYRKDDNLGSYTIQQDLVVDADRKGGSISFTNFAQEEGADNIYTISVTTKDLAGNPSTATATFSVNRFGSTYMLTSSTYDTVTQHWVNGEWLEDKGSIEIVEINPDQLSSKKVTVTRGSEIITLEEGKGYQVTEKAPVKAGSDNYQTESHWYEYTYSIPVSNFELEGEYTVSLLTTDQAENQQTNEATGHATNLFSQMGSELVYDASSAAVKVNFVVDKTSPVNTVSNLDKASYIESEHPFTVLSQDETMLDRVEVYLDGQLVQTVYEQELAESNYQFDYRLTSKDARQTVQVVAYDKAGNQSDAKANEYSVLVTSNLWIQFINSWLAIAIAVIVVALVVIWIIFLVKRKKDREKKTQKV